MKKDIMKKWVKLLRSDEIQQGKTTLENSHGHMCCLGVLCNIALVEGQVESGLRNGEYRTFGKQEEESYLPREVVEWAGMKTDDGRIKGKKSLTSMNDVHNKSFRQIANYIEKNYKDL